MKNTPRPLFPTFFDLQLGTFACYAMAFAVFVLGFWRLFSIEATEIQFLMSSLLILNLSVMSFIAGLLLPVSIQRMQLLQAEQQSQQ